MASKLEILIRTLFDPKGSKAARADLDKTGKELDELKDKGEATQSRLARGWAIVVAGSKRVRAAVAQDITIFKKLKTIGGNALDRLRKGFRLVTSAAKIFTIAIGAGAGVVTAFGVASLKSAANMEMLRTQLEAVVASKEDADRAFRESLEFSIRTPFTPNDIIQTRIALEGVGVRGGKAVESVASAAAALGRNILDVASAVKSLETEPLRNLGIMLKRQGDKFLFQYQTKMGKAAQIQADGFRAAQETLLNIMSGKFSDGLAHMSATFEGKISTLKGAWDQMLSVFAEGYLPEAKKVVDDLIERITAWTEGDTLRQVGEDFGGIIDVARERFMQFVDSATSLVADIYKFLKAGGEFSTVLQYAGLKVKAHLLDAAVEGLAFVAKHLPGIVSAVMGLIRSELIGGIKKEVMIRASMKEFDVSREQAKKGYYQAQGAILSADVVGTGAGAIAHAQAAKIRGGFGGQSSTDNGYWQQSFETDQGPAIIEQGSSRGRVSLWTDDLGEFEVQREELIEALQNLAEQEQAATDQATEQVNATSEATEQQAAAAGEAIEALVAGGEAVADIVGEAAKAAQESVQMQSVVAEHTNTVAKTTTSVSAQMLATDDNLQLMLDMAEASVKNQQLLKAGLQVALSRITTLASQIKNMHA